MRLSAPDVGLLPSLIRCLTAMKLSELASKTGVRVEGNGDVEVSGAAGLDEAEQGHVTFLSNPRYTPRVKTTRASAIYVGEDTVVDRNDIALLRAKDPYLAYTRALILFYPEPQDEPFIHPSAVIDGTARVADDVTIGGGGFGPRRIGRAYGSRERYGLRQCEDRF